MAKLEDIRAEFDGQGLVDLIAGRKGPGGLPSVALETRGGRIWGLCPFHNEKSPSFKVDPDRVPANWYCFGCRRGGSAFDYVMEALGCDFTEAMKILDGSTPVQVDPKVEADRAAERAAWAAREFRDKARRVDTARALWRRAQPAAGTVVPLYLQSRGITTPPPPTLRFIGPEAQAEICKWANPADRTSGLGSFPAMIAPFQDADGQIRAVHLTFLQPDGSGKAPVTPSKQIFGLFGAAAIRLSGPAPTMAIGEGIETCLSILDRFPGWSVWCAGSLGNMAGPGLGPSTVHPSRADMKVPSRIPDMRGNAIVIPPVAELFVLGDGDGDRPTAEALVARAVARYRRRQIPTAPVFAADGMDFNDMARIRAARVSA